MKGIPFRSLRTLRSRILLGYGFALCLMAVGIGWSVVNLYTLGQASDSILRENYKSILAAENMINAVERQDSALLAHMLGIDAGARSQFSSRQGEFQQWLGRAKDNITIDGEREILGTVEGVYGRYVEHVAGMFALPAGEPSASGIYSREVLPLFNEVRESCIALRQINQTTMIAASEQAQRLAQRAIWSTVSSGAVVIGFGLLVSFILASRLARPVERMREATLRLAEGDYGVEIPERGGDELADLSAQFNRMARRLRHYHDLNIGNILAEKRKTEAILQSVDDGIVVIDMDFAVSDLNPLACRIFGVRRDDVRGDHVLEALGRERIFEQVKQAAETGRRPDIPAEQAILDVADGEKTSYFQYSVTPVRGGSDKVLGVLLVLRDVTRLHELDRLKSEFVMTASHELRTPLTSIGMSVDLLLERGQECFGDRELELLRIAQEDVQRLKALVTELLDLSRIEAGRMEMEFESVPSGLLCDKAVSVLASQAGQKGVALHAQCDPDVPSVRADPNKITWVLVNLAGNALRHTDGSGRIDIRAVRAGEFVHFSVADDGEGIPREFQGKIFDKFVQLKSDRTSGGSGLGLSICREIVRAHGGAIWVESEPGKGSIFTFTLPLV